MVSADSGLGALREALLALVGTHGPETQGRVWSRDFRRFAIAVDDLDPIYFDDDAARAAGYPASVAPPVFLSATMDFGHGPALANLRPDGTGADRTSWLPLEGFRLMGGGQDLAFHRPVLDGTEVRVRSTLESVAEKEGRSGPFLLLGLRTTYRDGSDQPLVECDDTIIVREEEPRDG
jgi:acyl dehydratase